ncbi:MAG: hypothetical protein ACI4LI_08055 [Candidatus Fimenecus sp.]
MKRAQVIWFRAKPLLWCCGIFFLLSAIFGILSMYAEIFIAIFFFLYGAIPFRYQTELYLQFGVSRARQIGSIFALVPICALSGVLYTLLTAGYLHIFAALEAPFALEILSAGFTELTGTKAILWATLYVSLVNSLALFGGCFLGILLYMRPKNNRVTAVLAIGAVLLLCGGLRAAVPYIFFARYTYNMVVPHSDLELFIQGVLRNILCLPDGDDFILPVTALLFWCTIVASGVCLLLRRLPKR